MMASARSTNLTNSHMCSSVCPTKLSQHQYIEGACILMQLPRPSSYNIQAGKLAAFIQHKEIMYLLSSSTTASYTPSKRHLAIKSVQTVRLRTRSHTGIVARRRPRQANCGDHHIDHTRAFIMHRPDPRSRLSRQDGSHRTHRCKLSHESRTVSQMLDCISRSAALGSVTRAMSGCSMIGSRPISELHSPEPVQLGIAAHLLYRMPALMKP